MEILPILKRKYKKHTSSEEALVYRGYEGQKNIWREMLRVGEDNYAIGAKGGWFEPKLTSARLEFFKKAKLKKIKSVQLFDAEVKTKAPNIIDDFGIELKYRFLPKEYSTDSLIQIFGDYVVSYTGLSVGRTNENVVFFVIKSKSLAESYRTWFWCLWKQSTL